MSLAAGTRLGAYEILDRLGEGGMGVVYRARDTRLGRDVAIKVVPDLFADDADRVARFTREAQTLATLNHPNIAQIYGLEEADGVRALVMELVDGEDLAVMLSRGPVPLADTIAIARQIAEALEAAHDSGIVHRDLKPANIKIRRDGTVKVLDFGLAKALGLDLDSGSFDAMRSPTLTARATQMGVILGTAAYMAPEQAKGRIVDRRADIWAFGVIVHEMLTGDRLFDGETIPETLAHVLTREIDASALPPGTPPHLRQLVARCLIKDPRQRLRDIGEARLALVDDVARSSAGSPVLPTVSTTSQPRTRWREATAWSLAVLLAGIAGGQLWRGTAGQANAALLRLAVPLDVPQSLAGLSLALAPDGHALVLEAPWRSGDKRLALRRFSGSSFEPLPGTEEGIGPFWSPDSRSIAFVAGGQLKRFDLQTSSVRRVSAAPALLSGGAWGAGTILLGMANGPLVRAPASGGEPVSLRLDPAVGEVAQFRPVFLPDGRRFIYQSARGSTEPRMVLASLDSETRLTLSEQDVRVIWAGDDYLVYRRGEGLYAQRVEYGQFVLLDEPTLLSADLDTNLWAGTKESATSGLIAFFGRIDRRRQFTWYSRNGAVGEPVGPPGEFMTFDLSSDGRRIATAQRAGMSSDLWTLDAREGTASRVTIGATRDVDPRWLPDGRTILFGSLRDPARSLHRVPASGGEPSMVWKFDGRMFALDSVSSDGRWVLYHDAAEGELQARLIDPVVRTGETREQVVTVARELTGRIDQGQFSPDGRWVAFAADGSGQSQIVVVPFPATGDRWQVSKRGGVQPMWRADGRELYFVAPDGHLMAVPITVKASFEAGAAVPLFKTRLAVPAFAVEEYAPAADGTRFLVLDPGAVTKDMAIDVVANWRTLLAAR